MTIQPPARARLRAFVRAHACAGAGAVLLALACATSSSATPTEPAAAASSADGTVKYPPRRPGCELAIYYASVPGVPVWDDVGVAEVGCNIGVPLSQCVGALRAEACRMGGDILYDVPHEPMRPRDQVMVYRGHVAHTRNVPVPTKQEDKDLPPAASPEEAAGPVQPLTGPAAPSIPAAPAAAPSSASPPPTTPAATPAGSSAGGAAGSGHP